ncbi:MAG TPA: glycosyltransferase [Acidobacteriaceae bacterium]
MSTDGGAARALVSVVICAYNNWPDLEMTIESALCQSYAPVEVIVVDNSSTDATEHEVAERFGGRVRYIRQENRGDGGAYNTGFGAASGELIQFVDGDDVLAPNKIEKQVAIFEERPEVDIVYGDIRQFQTMAGIAAWKDVATQPESDILMELISPRRSWTGIGALGVLFRRRALETVGPWDESLYISDLDYWLRAAWAGCRFAHCPGSPMGFMRRRQGQMSANRAAMGRGLEAVWQKALGYVTREPYRGLLAEQLAEYRFRTAVARVGMRRREALDQLALARATSPAKVSAPAYVFGYATIVLPGGSFLVRSRWLQAIRRRLASLFRFRRFG